MNFELLDPKKHNRKNFDCGVEELNEYLRKYANQDQKRSLTRIYVLADEEKIVGYYSISAHSVLRENLPEGQRAGGYEDLPFLLLGRLAVDQNYRGQGYGDTLIYHAFKTTIHASETIGVMGMIVDAKNERAVSFYEGFGFIRLVGTRNRLALPLSVIKNLLEDE